MIRILPAHIANRIAAGEVIERPASVVKELVENSLDASATRITVEIEEGGKKLIRVTDNGSGIGEEDLKLTFHPHATSKIIKPEDLFEVLSYGFRGEALASIGSVARASIVSRITGQPDGYRIECERSETSEVIEAGAPEGTTVEIRDLFYNTPARRKFLKSDSAEVARTSEVLTRLCLARPDIKVDFKHNGRRVLSVDAAKSEEDRLIKFFGKELKGKLLPIHAEMPGIIVSGFIGTPEVARPSSNRQYLFLNERFISDKSLSHAVSMGFEGFVMGRRYPVFFIYLDIDPSTVDVNVHPTKAQVRFRERNQVFSAIKKAVSIALTESRPTGTWSFTKPQEAEAVAAAPIAPVEFRPTRHERVEGMKAELFPELANQLRECSPEFETRTTPPIEAGSAPVEYFHNTPVPVEPTEVAPLRFMQIHKSYILVEEKDGFYIIDQHAMHERMLFEQIWQRVGRGEQLSQRLLIPEVIELSPAELERFRGLADELQAIGFVLSPFGGTSIAVEEVPIELARSSPGKLVETLLRSDDHTLGAGIKDLKRDVVANMACRAAVKFNDRLSDAQIRELLIWEQSSSESSACPHGRPTRIALSMKDLERQFLRNE
ncbi:MAG: DNA mismatch repair protein MutL [Planctomycetota bacterium]|jgi:DNA mismatch repair protein MutL